MTHKPRFGYFGPLQAINSDGIAPSMGLSMHLHRRYGNHRSICWQARRPIQQEARIYAGLFDSDEHVTLGIAQERKVYLHLARGKLIANAVQIQPSNTLMFELESQLILSDGIDAEVLVFELP